MRASTCSATVSLLGSTNAPLPTEARSSASLCCASRLEPRTVTNWVLRLPLGPGEASNLMRHDALPRRVMLPFILIAPSGQVAVSRRQASPAHALLLGEAGPSRGGCTHRNLRLAYPSRKRLGEATRKARLGFCP